MKKLKNKKYTKFYLLKQFILGITDAALILLIVAIGFVSWIYYSQTPAASQLANRRISETSAIYDRSGQHVLYEMHGEENRKIISHDTIPDSMRIATIATEDSGFYRHYGIDPLAIARAAKVNLKSGAIMQGASTITQQLARSAFLTSERTIKRKFLEAVFAIKIERHYSKDEILDQYLNEVPYGSNTYGVETASLTFFGKSAKDLTLDEAALLAAMPKAPSYYSPYSTHRKELVLRQKNVLKRIEELELASSEEVEAALKVDTISKVKSISQPIVAPHFVFFVLDQLENKYGKEFVQTGGLKIYTTIDLEMQKLGEEVVAKGAQKNISRGASNAALVAVDPKNGEILAMVGSKNFYDKAVDGEVNVAISPRQPGSSFKPFAYAAAFMQGYEPETLILDARTNFGPGGANGGDYIPRNYDGKFHGLLPMRSTLAMSLNVPAVKVLYLAGINRTIDLAQSMGITTLNDRKRYGLSLVLGGGEVKLLDMTSAFSVFATEGLRNPVHPIMRIENRKGNFVEGGQTNTQRVLDVQIARKINSILSDNKARTPIFGPRSPLVLDGKTVAAKTGTTSQFRDAWTVGYTPSIAVGVWAGNNDNRPMHAGADGVFVAAPIWHEYMTKILAEKSNETFVAYDTYKKNDLVVASDEALRQASGEKMKMVVTYYNNKTGKKISAEKARKTDPKKVAKKIEYLPVESGDAAIKTESAPSIALPSPSDPMYKQWAGQLNGTVLP